MAFFDKESLTIISDQNNVDLSKASYNKALSGVEYDSQNNTFYITVDKVLFSGPVSAIKSVLEAQGYVANLENILSCLDSFVFSIRAKVIEIDNEDPIETSMETSTVNSQANSKIIKINEYIPCLRFELPQKNHVGEILQSFYDEIAKYDTKVSERKKQAWVTDSGAKNQQSLKAEVKQLKATNKALEEQVATLTQRLLSEQNSLSRASRALDSQQTLPDNTKICRVEQVDFKRRIIKVKSLRKVFDIPTHMLDRVPDYKARCLITFDQESEKPISVLFFDNEELGSMEKRTAELLYVEGDTFKARDSRRNEFQIKAVNAMEKGTIKSLKRGMKVLISVADGYVVRFSILNSEQSKDYQGAVQEQLTVYEIGRNQLLDINTDNELSSELEEN